VVGPAPGEREIRTCLDRGQRKQRTTSYGAHLCSLSPHDSAHGPRSPPCRPCACPAPLRARPCRSRRASSSRGLPTGADRDARGACSARCPSFSLSHGSWLSGSAATSAPAVACLLAHVRTPCCVLHHHHHHQERTRTVRCNSAR
jgi:hypothetical protein